MDRDTAVSYDEVYMQQKYQQVQMHLENDELEEALEETRLLLAEHGDNPQSWCLEGIVRLALQEFQAAHRAFDRACEISPDDPAPMLHKTRFMLAMDQHEEALRLTQSALEHAEDDQDRVDAYLLQVQALMGRSEEIMDSLEEEMDEDGEPLFEEPDDEEDFNLPLEVEALMEKGIGIAEKAIALEEHNPEAWFFRSVLLTNLRRLDDAIESWERALELDPNNPLFWHEAANLHAIDGDFEKAHKYFMKLYELEVKNNAEEGMEFALYEFEQVAMHAAETLQAEFAEQFDVFLPISVEVQEFPSRKLMEQASQRQPFDPWTACHVEIEAEEGDEPSLNFLMFQRNVERQLVDDSPEHLEQSLYELLQQILMESIKMMDSEEVIEA